MGEANSGHEPSRTVRKQISPTLDDGEYEFLEIIAELEGKAMDELPSLYDEVDHLVENLFNDPPAPQAHVEITFSYAGYRCRIDQKGNVKVVDVTQSRFATDG